jgi:hypothetical protein
MKYTLLKCVQLILSGLTSDEVNDISDTTEATMVVDILEQTYYDVAATIDFPDHWDFFELTATSSSTPTQMSIPTNVGKLEYIKLDRRISPDTIRDFYEVKPMVREDFFDKMNGLDTDEDNVYSYTISNSLGTFEVRGYNDRFPSYYTTFDDNTILFDNYDADAEDMIVATRTWCYGNIIPTFTRSNAFTPDFPPRQFNLFFNEAKAQAFHDIKQTVNPKAEQRARRGWVQAGRKKPVVPAGRIYDDYTYDFGRKRSS